MSEPRAVAGRYTLVRRIGAGAMGTVWLARDETLRREVAIKQITDRAFRTDREAQTASARAMREGRMVARLNHPNVVTIFDVVRHDNQPWLVMEYVPSKTLNEVVRADGGLPVERVATIGAQLAGALAEAHRVGVVHRDVKPGNVLLAEADVAKLTDFGIARGGAGDTLTETGLLAGTPAYFAPEIARGADPAPQSDVWSLGATLYYAVEGRAPFGSDGNPLAVLGRIATQDVPPATKAGILAPVLSLLLTRDPADRPTMTEAAALLAAVPAPRVATAAPARPSTVPSALPPRPAVRRTAAPPTTASSTAAPPAKSARPAPPTPRPVPPVPAPRPIPTTPPASSAAPPLAAAPPSASLPPIVPPLLPPILPAISPTNTPADHSANLSWLKWATPNEQPLPEPAPAPAPIPPERATLDTSPAAPTAEAPTAAAPTGTAPTAEATAAERAAIERAAIEAAAARPASAAAAAVEAAKPERATGRPKQAQPASEPAAPTSPAPRVPPAVSAWAKAPADPEPAESGPTVSLPRTPKRTKKTKPTTAPDAGTPEHNATAKPPADPPTRTESSSSRPAPTPPTSGQPSGADSPGGTDQAATSGSTGDAESAATSVGSGRAGSPGGTDQAAMPGSTGDAESAATSVGSGRAGSPGGTDQAATSGSTGDAESAVTSGRAESSSGADHAITPGSVADVAAESVGEADSTIEIEPVSEPAQAEPATTKLARTRKPAKPAPTAGEPDARPATGPATTAPSEAGPGVSVARASDVDGPQATDAPTEVVNPPATKALPPVRTQRVRTGPDEELDENAGRAAPLADLLAARAAVHAAARESVLPAPPLRLPAKRHRRDGRLAWVVAAALLVVCIVAAVLYLANLDRGTPANTGAGRSAAPNPVPTKSTVTTPPKSSSSSAPAATTTPPRTSGKPSDKPPAGNPMRTDAMIQFVGDYYRLMPANTVEGWKRLGPSLKTIGYDSYTRFWGRIASVSITNLSADPAAKTVTGTVTFVEKGGGRDIGRHTFDLVTTPDGTGLLINRDNR